MKLYVKGFVHGYKVKINVHKAELQLRILPLAEHTMKAPKC